MARGVNKVIILGNLGADPDSRSTPGGTTVCNLSVATTENWRNRETGEQQQHTEWHRVVMFGKLAEIAAEYLRKGSKVYLEGRLRTNKYEDKEGTTKYSTQIIADELQMLDRRPEGAASESVAEGASGSNAGAPSDGDDFSDDIPF